MMPWNPNMEEAPRDGTEFDAWCPWVGRVTNVSFHRGEFMHFDCGPVGGRDFEKAPSPLTHWMPIPSSPSEEN